MPGFIYSPPIVFIIFVVISLLISRVFSLYSFKNPQRDRGLDAYACGERDVRHYINPDYGQFFPYAFFFTIMHVLVLVVATAPGGALLMPLLYTVAGVLAMVIVLKS